MFFCDFFEVTEIFSVGDDGFLELRRVSGCGGIVRSSGGGLATRQAGNVLLGGASGAGSLLLNTKASQEAACSRAPAAIVPGPEPELHDAGVSRFGEIDSHPAEVDTVESRAGQVERSDSSGNAGIGSHPEATDAAEGHAGQVDGPGSSGNAGIGSHLAEADVAEGHARQVDSPGSSGNAGIGSHLVQTDAAKGLAGQVGCPGGSEFAKNGSHPAAADFSNEPGAVLWRHTPLHRTESGLLSYETASPDSSVQKTALWRTRGSS